MPPGQHVGFPAGVGVRGGGARPGFIQFRIEPAGDATIR